MNMHRFSGLAALVLAAVFSSHAASAQPAPQQFGIPFPNFAIDAECVRQAGPPKTGPSTGFDFRACRLQEFQSRDELAGGWPNLPHQAILECLPQARGTGFGSYGILRACLDGKILRR